MPTIPIEDEEAGIKNFKQDGVFIVVMVSYLSLSVLFVFGSRVVFCPRRPYLHAKQSLIILIGERAHGRYVPVEVI